MDNLTTGVKNNDYAHELRAPLSNIIGLIGLLEIETSNSLKNEIIEMLKTSASALDTATRTVIHQAKFKNGLS